MHNEFGLNPSTTHNHPTPWIIALQRIFLILMPSCMVPWYIILIIILFRISIRVSCIIMHVVCHLWFRRRLGFIRYGEGKKSYSNQWKQKLCSLL